MLVRRASVPTPRAPAIDDRVGACVSCTSWTVRPTEKPASGSSSLLKVADPQSFSTMSNASFWSLAWMIPSNSTTKERGAESNDSSARNGTTT